MRTTIKDIAGYTGLSVTTVSLVLNHKADKIPQRTRDKVIKAVEELNYRPNQLAVGLVKKRTETIGLIISDVSNVFFANLAKGVEDECRRKGWNLVLCNTNDKHERDLSYISVLADKGVDGILFCMSLDSNKRKTRESIHLLEKLKLPFVMIDRFLEEADCISVVVDHKHGGYLAAKKLLELGHKKIGCVTGPQNLADSRNRLDGYCRALEEYHIGYDEALIFGGNYDRKSGEAAVNYLKDKVTAIFAFNDMSAYGVYKELKRSKIAIPGQMSLIGYDDIFFSEMLDVPLTTIHQPIYEMGVEAVHQLITEIDSGSNTKKCITFQPTLIERESVGKCPLL